MSRSTFITAAVVAATLSGTTLWGAIPMTPSISQGASLLNSPTSGTKKVEVHNRILTTINDVPISVVDVQKQLDLLFYQQFPEYADVAEARVQFYQANWRYVLQDLIDKELISADAVEISMETSQGDVRQEMEQMFGPNILTNLQKAGITYEDAWKMISQDMLLRRMMMTRVNMRAYSQVKPDDVRAAYNEYMAEHQGEDSYTYRMITIRGADEAMGAEIAQHVHDKLQSKEASIDNLDAIAKELGIVDGTVTLRAGETVSNESSKINPDFLAVLKETHPGDFSAPQAQFSRAANSTVHRIFYLEDMAYAEQPSFRKMEARIRNALLDKAVGEESERYLTHLRDHFHVSEEELMEQIPSDFQPFSLV